MKFSDIETISQGVSDYLSDNKIVDMTEIQRQTYKHIMDNRDIIACSSTGTGKTLAYLIPIINRLKSNTHNIQAVVLVPTHRQASPAGSGPARLRAEGVRSGVPASENPRI